MKKSLFRFLSIFCIPYSIFYISNCSKPKLCSISDSYCQLTKNDHCNNTDVSIMGKCCDIPLRHNQCSSNLALYDWKGRNVCCAYKIVKNERKIRLPEVDKPKEEDPTSYRGRLHHLNPSRSNEIENEPIKYRQRVKESKENKVEEIAPTENKLEDKVPVENEIRDSKSISPQNHLSDTFLNYDPETKKGFIIKQGNGEKVRKIMVQKIGQICSNKNILIKAGSEVFSGGAYKTLSESSVFGSYRIDFKCLY